jgi:hypothetical protein
MRLHHLLAAASIISAAAITSTASAQASANAQTGVVKPAAATSASSANREAVTRAALDYLEGFYEGDTAKLVRALTPDMYKYGFSRDAAGKYTGMRMTFAEALDFARRVKARNRPPNPAWPKKVEVYEVLERTASAKVTAWWGTDYLLLGNHDGRWVISHVLWESPPPE